MREKVLGLRVVTAGRNQTRAKDARMRFVTPLDIPAHASAVLHIDLRACSRQVLADESERRLRLALNPAGAVLKIECRRVTRFGPQNVPARRSLRPVRLSTVFLISEDSRERYKDREAEWKALECEHAL